MEFRDDIWTVWEMISIMFVLSTFIFVPRILKWNKKRHIDREKKHWESVREQRHAVKNANKHTISKRYELNSNS